MLFITNYRLSIAESMGKNEYAEAIVRVVLFPIFYFAAFCTNLLFESSLLQSVTKTINKVWSNQKTISNKGYVIDELGRLHLGNEIPRYTDNIELFDKAIERGLNKVHQTGKSVCLGDVIKEIEAERR